MIAALLVGLGFGFSGGITPGPLTTLVMTTSLQRGFAAGSRFAVAPLLSDAPIIAITVFFVGSMPDAAVRVLAIVGGVFLLYLGVQTVRAASEANLSPVEVSAAQDYRRGVIVNTLNPHPWLFWITVGAPTVIGYWRVSGGQAIAFIFGFYVLLVGGKLMLAYLVARGGQFLSKRAYQALIVGGGVMLIGLGSLILWQNGLATG